MLHACVERFDVMGVRGNILGWEGEVNKAMAVHPPASRRACDQPPNTSQESSQATPVRRGLSATDFQFRPILNFWPMCIYMGRYISEFIQIHVTFSHAVYLDLVYAMQCTLALACSWIQARRVVLSPQLASIY